MSGWLNQLYRQHELFCMTHSISQRTTNINNRTLTTGSPLSGQNVDALDIYARLNVLLGSKLQRNHHLPGVPYPVNGGPYRLM